MNYRDEDLDATNCLYELGNLLFDQGQYDEGEVFLRRELSAVEVREGKNSDSVAARLFMIGKRLADCGKFDEAAKFLRRELEITEEKCGSEHEDVMFSLSKLGDVLRIGGHYEHAEQALIRAVELGQKHLIGAPFFNLAKLRIDQKGYDEAQALLLRCLKICQQSPSPDDNAISRTINKIAEVYRLMGREADAFEVEKKLLALAPEKDAS